MNMKIIGAFVAGAAIGALVGVVFTRDKYEKESQQAIESVKDYYKNLSESPLEAASERFEESTDDSAINQNKVADIAESYMPPEEDQNEIALGPTEYPDRPYEISEDEYFEENVHYNKEQYYFYPEDEVFLDEEYDIVVNPLSLFGNDIISKFDDPDDLSVVDEVYIRNDNLSRDFEIIKCEGHVITGFEGDNG